MARLIAHAIFCVKAVRETRDRRPVWENVFLVQASSEAEAWEVADRVAGELTGTDDKVKGVPRSEQHLTKDIRAITWSMESPFQVHLEQGEEICCSTFVVASEEDAARMEDGLNVYVLHGEAMTG